MAGENSSRLERYVSDWRPDPVETVDGLAPARAGDLGATLDLDFAARPGDELPPMWHWVYFTEWPSTADLGADGHPRDGHFLPPIPHRRRMFAGGNLHIHGPLVLGRRATRRAQVMSATVKHGKTGELLFVKLRHEFSQDGEVRLAEEQDLVYRSDAGSATTFTRVTEPLPARRTPWAYEPGTHPALLFRFSALTANAHRIHYDEPYATRVEGFPALVVHGPLIAMYMAELARGGDSRPLRSFVYRLNRPVFVGDPIRVEGGPAAGGAGAELRVVSATDNVHAVARAVYA